MKTLSEISRQPAGLLTRFGESSRFERPLGIRQAKPVVLCQWEGGNPPPLLGDKRRKRALILELTLSCKYVVMRGTKRIPKTVRKSEIFPHSSPLGFFKKSESVPWCSGGRCGFCMIHPELIEGKKVRPNNGFKFSKN